MSAGEENAFEVRAVDPTGANPARTVSEPGGSWYPTPNRLPLAIVTTDAPDSHTEQLVLLEPVRKLGPVTRFVRSPHVSPDGRFIVLEADPQSFRDLYRLDVETEELVRLTDEPSGSFEPALSPDGAQVAFTSSRDGDAELYVLDLATKKTRQLTDAPSDDWGAMWSPDGTQLAFVSDRDGGKPRLFVIAADGTGTAPAHIDAPRGEETGAAWSPDGTRLVYAVAGRDGGSEIWVAAPATGGVIRVSAPGARDEAPAWSPNGRHLVYVSTRDRRIDLYVARADGSAEHRLTDTPEEEWIPRWLPRP